MNQKFQLEERIKNFEFKLPYVRNENKFNLKKTSMGIKEKEYNSLKIESSFGIKNFTNFGITNYKNSELEFYKKKCISLEDNLKELNKRLNEDKMTMIYSPLYMDDKTKHQSNFNGLIENVTHNESRKKTLTPISKSVTPIKNCK